MNDDAIAGVQHQPMQPLIALYGLRLFFALLVITIAFSQTTSPSKLFLEAHGRGHRLAGAAHLTWLLIGTAWLVHPNNYDSTSKSWARKCMAYDIILGILGTLATLTAARDFPHRRVTNRPGESGTLSRQAVVTQGEMIEHAFYQALNLWQALYLHAITWAGAGTILTSTLFGRMILLWVGTLPWAWRRLFPVNSFSANWTRNKDAARATHKTDHKVQVVTKISLKGLSSINKMYQVKKWQYVFYKHVILHGLNISMAFPKGYQNIINNHNNSISSYNNDDALPTTFQWRIFWLCLNTSYVMEFFLQSLVKRRILRQRSMMVLNALLMASSTLAAMGAVFGSVRAEAALISLLLNFGNRHCDVWNTILTGSIVAIL